MSSEFWTMIASVSSLFGIILSIWTMFYNYKKLVIIWYKKNNRFFLKNIWNNPFLWWECILTIRPTKQGIIQLYTPGDTYWNINDYTKKINIFIQPVTIQEELEISDIIKWKTAWKEKIILDENNWSEYSRNYNEAISQAEQNIQDEFNFYMNNTQEDQEEIDDLYEVIQFEEEFEYLYYHVFEIRIKRNHLIIFK